MAIRMHPHDGSTMNSKRPNYAIQRMLRASHEMCNLTARAVPYMSLILRSLNIHLISKVQMVGFFGCKKVGVKAVDDGGYPS